MFSIEIEFQRFPLDLLAPRESGLRVATPPERGIFKLTIRPLSKMHQELQKLCFLETLIRPLKVF